jgi:hypothetical protein
MKLLSKPWTPEDDERLKALVTQGASVVRVAAALKRSHQPVRERARKLGCPFPPLRIARKKWGGSKNNLWREY